MLLLSESGLVFVRAHDGEYARCLRWVGGIFRAAVHVRGVVVHFEKVGHSAHVEVAEVMLATRVVLPREFLEVTNALKNVVRSPSGNERRPGS